MVIGPNVENFWDQNYWWDNMVVEKIVATQIFLIGADHLTLCADHMTCNEHPIISGRSDQRW